MRILIVGAGEVGFNIARKLAEEHHEVVLIDKSKEKIKRVEEILDVKAILGSATSPRVLMEAGLKECDLMIAATDSDEVNLVVCFLSKKLNPKVTKIARIRNVEYTHEYGIISKDVLGIDYIIDPGMEMVKNIMHILEHPWASDVIDLADGKLRLVAISIGDNSALKGIRLRDFKPKESSLLIGAIVREDKVIIPRGDDAIQKGDLVYFVTVPGRDENISHLSESKVIQTKRVMIVGGGQVGLTLAKTLEHKKISAKIIEKDPHKCQVLAEELEKVMVINGDATDKDLLVEEDVGEMDFIIALTEDEENNILCSLLAKKLGAKKAITRINRLTYLPLVSSIGIDIVVSSRLAAVKAILGFVRRGKVLSVTPLRSENAEVIEAEAVAGTPIVNRPLKNINFPLGAIVGAIVREGKVIIPKGDTIIKPTDKLIIFAMEKSLAKVENLLTATR